MDPLQPSTVVTDPGGPDDAPPRTARSVVAAYIGLCKPRVIELLLVTTVPTMVVAARGFPDFWLVITTLVGGTLAAGSANTINSYLERDLDKLMARTRRRPLAQHRVPPRNALVFGVVLGVASLVWLGLLVNPLSAALAFGAIFFYVVIYTMGLKRRTPQNVVIGGAAGCMPVLIGWSAVTGEVGLPAFALFAIIFTWTPPHTWALALKYRDDYEAAGVPMLPVVEGPEGTARQILLYSILLVSFTLMFGPVGGMGTIYLVAALVLGAGFIMSAVRLMIERTEARAMGLFRYSISYLGLLFIAMAVDAVRLG